MTCWRVTCYSGGVQNTFNLNDSIWVQLTEFGREHARKVDYPIKEDSSGWSEWTAWHFMKVFGERMIMGTPEVCSMNIRLAAPDPKSTGLDELDDLLRRITILESAHRLTHHRLAAAAQMCADIDRDPRVHTSVQACFSHVGKALESEPQEDDGHV